jgi:hypothetical protein
VSRFSRAELHRFVVEQGVCEASASTIGRWLAEDAIKPSRYRSWIFPRDPDFLEKAGRVLDLYQGRWEASCWSPAISWSALMRSRRSKLAAGFIPPCRRHGVAGNWSSTSTSGSARSPIWTHRTCAAAE